MSAQCAFPGKGFSTMCAMMESPRVLSLVVSLHIPGCCKNLLTNTAFMLISIAVSLMPKTDIARGILPLAVITGIGFGI